MPDSIVQLRVLRHLTSRRSFNSGESSAASLEPGFPGWIAPAGLKAAETLTKLPIPYFHPSGPSEFGYLIQRKGLI